MELFRKRRRVRVWYVKLACPGCEEADYGEYGSLAEARRVGELVPCGECMRPLVVVDGFQVVRRER